MPFGVSRLPSALFGKPFTETKREASPDSILNTLTEARTFGMRVFIMFSGASQRHYRNSDGTVNLAMWKARVDRFRPTMATMLRTDPNDLEEHAAGYKTPCLDCKWGYLDAASARYLARKGSVAKFAADQ